MILICKLKLKKAKASESSPIYFLIPVGFTISFSYMFAVSSAKNAIVFTGGYLKVKDMVVNILFVVLSYFCTYFI